MAQKKVEFNSKPAILTEPSIEDWVLTAGQPVRTTPAIDTEEKKVEGASEEKRCIEGDSFSEPYAARAPLQMKRLTIDVNETLHKAIKMRSVEQGVTMADLVRDLLEKSFPS